MKKKDLLKQTLDYAIYAVVLYVVFNAANYCTYMEQQCRYYAPFENVPVSPNATACLCDCNPNITPMNDTYYRWPNPENYPYVYSVMKSPDWIPNEDFEDALKTLAGMERWWGDYGGGNGNRSW